MRLSKKGQGATEYLLMLAAVLVIVAIAVYYVTTSTGAPSIVASVKLNSTDNTVQIRGETGCTVVANWSFSYKGGTVTDWQSGSDAIGPGDTITLTELTNNVSAGNTVTIKYDTTTKSATINDADQWVGLT